MILLKTYNQINKIDDANRIVHLALNKIEKYLGVGISTIELDELAKREILHAGAIPTFLGYNGFPKSVCISINEEIVHGIPREDKIIKDGDVVSVDIGATYEGFVGDAAKTIIVGSADSKVTELVYNTSKALMAGINQAQVGKTLHDISKAIDSVAKEHKYGNIKEYCGHGVGINLHEEPKVLNYVDGPNIHLQEGLVLAIEPMFALGLSDTKIMEDKWTVVTKDNSVAAHWELSLAITIDGPRILGI
jgi:methionyl aminopeptidase